MHKLINFYQKQLLLPLLLFMTLLLSFEAPAEKKDCGTCLKVMTYNIRHFDTTDCDEGNCWSVRKKEIVAVIEDINPDILVVQELSKLKDSSEEYESNKMGPINFMLDSLAGVEKDTDTDTADCIEGGNYCYIPGIGSSQKYIFYKKGSGITLEEHASIWLPPYTDEQVDEQKKELNKELNKEQKKYPCKNMEEGYKEEYANKRTLTWAKFKFKFKDEVEDEFFILNTHLYHENKDVRKTQMKCLYSILPDGMPSLVMGDFNAKSDELTENGELFKKGYVHLHPVAGAITYNRFGKEIDDKPLKKIDHIFGKNVKCIKSKVDIRKYSPETNNSKDTEDTEDRYPSDHHPLWAEVKLTKGSSTLLSESCKGRYFFLW